MPVKIEPPNAAMEQAKTASGYSPCQSKRGAVIFRGRHAPVSHGWNAAIDCDGSNQCKLLCRRTAVHAEQAALISAGMTVRDYEMLHVKTIDGKIVPSGPPSCVECSKLALHAGIIAFWLYHEDGWYRYAMTEFHQLSLCYANGRQSEVHAI